MCVRPTPRERDYNEGAPREWSSFLEILVTAIQEDSTTPVIPLQPNHGVPPVARPHPSLRVYATGPAATNTNCEARESSGEHRTGTYYGSWVLL